MSENFYTSLSFPMGEGVAHLPHLAHLWGDLIEIIIELLVRNR